MAKGVRRTPEQQIADLEKKIAELKARSGLNANHDAVKQIIDQVKAVAKENDWEVKAVIKVISDKLVVKQVRKPRVAKVAK